MTAPDPDADPETEPYRVLGIDPTEGVGMYMQKDRIEDRAGKLIGQHKGDTNLFVALQKAKKRVEKIHPNQSSSGTWRIPLIINVEKSTVEYRSSVTVRVTNFLNEPIPDATLRLEREDGQRIARTGTDGRASFTIGNGIGEFKIIAIKRAEGKKSYVKDATTVKITKKRKQLKFIDAPDSCTSGDTIDLKVTNSDGNPVQGVSVHSETGSVAKAKSDGCTQLTIDNSGKHTLTATKSDNTYIEYIDAKTTVSVKRQKVKLQFNSVPNQTEVGKQVTFRITNGSGDPVENATVKFAGTTDSTLHNGRVTTRVPAEAIGKTKVTVTKDDTSNTTFVSNQKIIQVNARTAELTFNNPPEEVSVATNVKFKIVDKNGNPVNNVEVSAGSTGDTTDKDGYATLFFDGTDVGDVSVQAKKKEQKGMKYISERTSVSVTKQEVKLSLTSQKQSSNIGNDIKFTVTDGSQPINNAIIECGNLNERTGPSGTASLTFDEAGKKTVVAHKNETQTTIFENARHQVHVRRLTSQLNLIKPKEKIESMSPVEFIVKNERGKTVSDATVSTIDTDPVKTDSLGRAEITFTASGEKKVTAEKSPTNRFEFIEDTATVTVYEPPKSVNISSVPDSVSVGESINIQVLNHRCNPVADAVIKTVSNQDARVDRTNEDGKLEISFQTAGYYTISATKDGFDIFDKVPIRVTD